MGILFVFQPQLMTELYSEVIRIIKGLQEKKVNGIKSLHKMKLIRKKKDGVKEQKISVF